MKIGTFAMKFHLNSSAIRFYINNGLLGPVKKGGQYEFDKECVSDMEKILKYKKYGFSLEEIQLLFFMEKTSRFKDEVIIDVCSELLNKKRGELIDEKDNLAKIIIEIEEEIENLPVVNTAIASDDDVPFSIIPFLYCPSCQVPLKLESATLSSGSIKKGDLSCECGYTAAIKDGIILCADFEEETPFKAFENIESIMSIKEQFSPMYRKLVARTYLWIYNKIINHQVDNKLILVGPFTFNFLLEYLEKLGKDHLYIIFDPSYKRIRKLKKYLSSGSYNIVFIVGKPADLPIRNETIDLYIDDYSTVNSLFTYDTFSVENIAPLLKKAGEVIGIFTSYRKAQKSVYNFTKDHPTFTPDKMTISGLKYHWSEMGIETIEDKVIGETTSNEPDFPQNETEEPIEIHGYHSKKVRT